MFSTERQVEFKAELKQMSADKYEEYASYAYSAGYMESMLVDMLALLPKRRQAEFIQQVKRINDDKKIKVKSLMSGELVEICRGDLGTCVDPSTERYWSM